MIVVHAILPIDPEHRDEALDVVDTLVEQSNREAGMIEYQATVDVQDENTIRFFERYEDEDAFESHLESDHFQEAEARFPELLIDEPEVIQFDVSEAIELEL